MLSTKCLFVYSNKITTLCKMCRNCLTNNLIYEQKSEGYEGAKPMRIWEEQSWQVDRA